jgi:hypothetical protein
MEEEEGEEEGKAQQLLEGKGRQRKAVGRGRTQPKVKEEQQEDKHM